MSNTETLSIPEITMDLIVDYLKAQSPTRKFDTADRET